MKVVRAPLRVSLFGGGTDRKPFISEHGSTIISFALNRHIYLSWNDRPTGGCHLGYSEVEELETLKDAKHTLVRETANVYGIPEPCTLTIVSDVPKGTGLGSSSALAVCLYRLIKSSTWWHEAVYEAAQLEQAVSSAGWQDYLPAAYGGFNIYHIAPKGVSMPMFRHVKASTYDGLDIGVTPVPDSLRDLINRHGLLLYTGDSRSADSLSGSWEKSESQLHDIKALADEVAGHIDSLGPEALGMALNETWEMKRSIPGVTSPTLDHQYAIAMSNGAFGGKLCGAGAGGCWFFLVPSSSVARARIKQALGLREIPFQISQKGVESWESYRCSVGSYRPHP
jgi:D-glycero-alpha-D-manno-heptose-7-phosphate kinase